MEALLTVARLIASTCVSVEGRCASLIHRGDEHDDAHLDPVINIREWRRRGRYHVAIGMTRVHTLLNRRKVM